jgi:membrane-associated protease RseP (regulator of RpoE activity)
MIFLAILIHVLGNLCPKWILKDNYHILQNNFSWKSSILKLSGLLTSLLFAFILISVHTLTSKDRYIENKNAIYGLEFSETMKAYGFENGDKIVSINGQGIDRVSEIIKCILLASGDVKVLVDNDNNSKELIIKDSDKYAIIKNVNLTHVKAKIQPNSCTRMDFKEVQITVTRFGVSKIFENFGYMWKQVTHLLSPKNSTYGQVGGFITISQIRNIHGYLLLLAFNSIFIGIVNLLPLPGFSLGNLLVSIIENNRRRLFNHRIMKIVRAASLSLAIAFIVIIINI